LRGDPVTRITRGERARVYKGPEAIMDIDGPGGGGWNPVVPRPTPPPAKPTAENPLRVIGDALGSVASRLQAVFDRLPVVRPNPLFGTPAPTATPVPTPSATATPTPTVSSAAPPTGPVYWGGLTEAQLASYQRRQGDTRNDCADYSVAAVLNMFQGGAVQGSDVARAGDLGNVLYGYRLWPNGPTTPPQAANIVNTIADRAGLPLSATAVRPETSADLVEYLRQPDTAVIVTIGWDDAHVPDIARTSDTGNSARGGAMLQINAHAMVLAAYDPAHLDRNGNPAPWGFVNSWADGGTGIYWIPDADFQQAWSHEIPLVGSHNAVVVTKTAAADAAATPTVGPVPVPTPPSPAATPPAATSTPSPPVTSAGR
jgi:hypothetical protein